MFFNELADGLDIFRIGFLAGYAFVLLHDDAVPSQNTIHRPGFRPNAHDPGPNARLLHRPWTHGHLVDSIMFSGKAKGFAGPQAIHDRETFVHEFGAGLEVHRFADFGESFIIRSGAQACRENQPASRKLIERSRLLREFPGTAPWNRSDERTEANALGLYGHARQHHPRVEQLDGLAAEALDGNTIGDEHSIPTRFFRGLRHIALPGRISTRNDDPVLHPLTLQPPRRIMHGMYRTPIFAAATFVVVAVLGVNEPSAVAQNKSVWDGVYTKQQADRGAASFAASCARCHTAEPNEEGRRPVVGKAFWQSFRESTVDRLLDYVSKNMPNGAGGTLEASTYLDLVAYILSRNDLPSGAAELTKESANGVQIIAKDGPGELPGGTLVNVVGCLARKDGGGWILNTATAPERPGPQPNADDATRPLGTRSYAMMFPLTSLDPYVGNRLRVRGLLIGDGGRDGINISTTQSLGKTCP